MQFIERKEQGKELTSDRRYVVRNGFWMLLNQGIGMGAVLALSIIFARVTTQEIFGNFNFLISVFSLLSVASLPGFNLVILKSVSRGYDGTYQKSIRIRLLWSIAGTLLLFLVGLYYYLFLEKTLGIGFFAAAAFFPFYHSLRGWTSFLQGKERFDLFAKYNSLHHVIVAAAVILAIFYNKADLVGIFGTYLLVYTLLNIVFYVRTLKLIQNTSENPNWKKSGFRLTIINFISSAYDHIDKILIGILLGPEKLALYVVASTLTIRLRGFVKEFLKIMYPKIFRMQGLAVTREAQSIIKRMLLGVILIIIPLLFVMPAVIPFLYSHAYAEAIFYAQLYLITIPFAMVVMLLSVFFIALNQEVSLLKIKSASITLTIILYFILIPLYGITGAIISSILYFVFEGGLQYYYLKRAR